MPFFDARAVRQQLCFVAWLDALGTKSALLVSHARAANFVMKIHAVCLEARDDYPPVRLFPMNDGIYAVSSDRKQLKRFLATILSDIADVFIAEPVAKHRFMVRGAIAYGSVSHGDQLHGNNYELRHNDSYIKNIILGMPLAQAVDAERVAPPFGIFVHESARMVPTEGAWSDVLWRWWSDDEKCRTLHEKILAHLAWAEANPIGSMYPKDALERHRRATEEYFGADDASLS
jgi:hypothetical protein